MEPTFLLFEQWCNRNEDLKAELLATGVKCPDCAGCGRAECFACGHTTECEECSDGIVVDPSSYQIEHEMRELYNAQKATDEKKLKDWERAVASVV